MCTQWRTPVTARGPHACVWEGTQHTCCLCMHTLTLPQRRPASGCLSESCLRCSVFSHLRVGREVTPQVRTRHPPHPGSPSLQLVTSMQEASLTRLCPHLHVCLPQHPLLFCQHPSWLLSWPRTSAPTPASRNHHSRWGQAHASSQGAEVTPQRLPMRPWQETDAPPPAVHFPASSVPLTLLPARARSAAL